MRDSRREAQADSTTDEILGNTFAIKLRLAELETANGALQRMIDALASMPDIDSFVPAALQIVSEALETKNCSFYEHRSGELIRLRYWFYNDRVFSTEEIASLTDDGLSLLREQARGFSVPDHHLGSTVRERTRATVVDHTRIDPPSINTALCKAQGWELELNVPLVVAGVAEGALVVLRGAGDRWSAREILLAERLAQPFALALEASRIAALAKEAAVLREREAAALQRADEVSRANAVMRSTLERLSDERDLLTFPSTILREAMRQTGAEDGAIFLFDAATNTIRAADLLLNPDFDGELPDALTQAFPTGADWEIAIERRAPVVIDLLTEPDRLPPGAAQWHLGKGSLCVAVAPMFVNKAAYGLLGLSYRRSAENVSNVDLGLIHALAQQATLAIQLTQLAESSQVTAIALEREQVVVQERAHMAREIHDKLARGYAAILMQQRAMRRCVQKDDGIVNSHLDIIERVSRESLAEARRTMDELKSNAFEPGSLQRAILRLREQWSGHLDFNVSFSIDGELPPVPRYVETELSCVIAEALSNARRHARAGEASVTVRRTSERLTICIRDKGVGFDVSAHGPSFGIPGMYERAARAGARLEIASSVGQGTDVLITIGK